MNLFEARPGRKVAVLMTTVDRETGRQTNFWEPAEILSRNFYAQGVCVEFIHSPAGLRLDVLCEEHFELPRLKPVEGDNGR